MFKNAWDYAKRIAKEHLSISDDNAVTEGIMIWMAVAILIVIFLPVISAVLGAQPLIVTNPTEAANVTTVQLGSLAMNQSQSSLTTMTAGSYGLLIVVLIILAAVVLIGVMAYIRRK